MKKYPMPPLEQVKEVIHRVDISRLENRLVGKLLIELEHCLIECLGSLVDDLRLFKEEITRQAQVCMEANSQDEFLYCYREYKKSKSEFGANHNMGSVVGRYFYALEMKLKEKELDGVEAVTHARIIASLVCRQIDQMWAHSQYTNERIEKLWYHWTETSSVMA